MVYNQPLIRSLKVDIAISNSIFSMALAFPSCEVMHPLIYTSIILIDRTHALKVVEESHLLVENTTILCWYEQNKDGRMCLLNPR